MQNNTDAFSWKRGKDNSRKLKEKYPSQAILLSFVFQLFIPKML